MDLAIAARVSELFGGTARLEAVQGQGTAIILDWPARIAAASGAPDAARPGSLRSRAHAVLPFAVPPLA